MIVTMRKTMLFIDIPIYSILELIYILRFASPAPELMLAHFTHKPMSCEPTWIVVSRFKPGAVSKISQHCCRELVGASIWQRVR